MRDESTQGSQATREFLDIVQADRFLHPDDCSNFIRISIDPSFGNKETEKLTRRDSESALCRVEFYLVASEVCEGLGEVS